MSTQSVTTGTNFSVASWAFNLRPAHKSSCVGACIFTNNITLGHEERNKLSGTYLVSRLYCALNRIGMVSLSRQSDENTKVVRWNSKHCMIT